MWTQSNICWSGSIANRDRVKFVQNVAAIICDFVGNGGFETKLGELILCVA